MSDPTTQAPSTHGSDHTPKHHPFAWSKKLHATAPKLAKKLSLASAASAITAQSVAYSPFLATFGATKIAAQKLPDVPLLGKLGKLSDRAIIRIADLWVNNNNYLIDRLLPEKDWRIRLPADLSPDKKYLLICNHQSWVDTSIIQYVSEGRLPLTRFFAKHELLYIPIVGQTFYLLDFPMMKRPSKKAVAKNPKLLGRDLAEAKRACQMLIDKPFVLLNYLEGTRFTQKKHTAQASPYTHLLKPKAGGFALALSSLGEEIDGILDMTIVYPDGVPEYNELWAGKLTRLGVDIRPAQMDEALFSALKSGGYHGDDGAVKEALHAWLDATWQAKDERIGQMLAEFV